MLTLGEKVRKIRSKNAGPFWITIDIFCGNKKIYKEIKALKKKKYHFKNIRVTKIYFFKKITLEL